MNFVGWLLLMIIVWTVAIGWHFLLEYSTNIKISGSIFQFCVIFTLLCCDGRMWQHQTHSPPALLQQMEPEQKTHSGKILANFHTFSRSIARFLSKYKTSDFGQRSPKIVSVFIIVLIEEEMMTCLAKLYDTAKHSSAVAQPRNLSLNINTM